MSKKERAIVGAFLGLLLGSTTFFIQNPVFGTYTTVILAILGAIAGYNWNE